MKPTITVGCSGFYNRQWKGIFYPEDMPSKEWFAYYCEHFSTFEINATFYKFPTLRVMLNWYKKAPEGFIYAVKAPKQITHIKKFEDCEDDINQFYTVIKEGLAEKLGCVLFQLPPGFSYSEERLQNIVSSLNADYKNVVEFRNESWWRPSVYNALAKNNIIFCTVNYPKLPTEVINTTPTGYIRLHGNPKLFYSEYSEAEIKELYKDIVSQKELSEVFIYFNNTASKAGILNAKQFEQLKLK